MSYGNWRFLTFQRHNLTASWGAKEHILIITAEEFALILILTNSTIIYLISSQSSISFHPTPSFYKIYVVWGNNYYLVLILLWSSSRTNPPTTILLYRLISLLEKFGKILQINMLSHHLNTNFIPTFNPYSNS